MTYARRHSAELLMLLAVGVLLAFYYFARADTIGVFSPTRGWTAMTGHPLPGLVHYPVAALLLAVIPLVGARQLTGLGARELGLGFGRWRAGLALLAIGLPLAVLAGRIGARSPAMRAVYPLVPGALHEIGFVAYALVELLYYAAWEVLFRGVLLFGLRPQMGDGPANVVQTAFSTIGHFGRAVNETAAAFPAGLVFGWIDLRLKSIWYIAAIHWTVAISLEWFSR